MLVPLTLTLATPPLLRALAMGEAGREALALMDVPPAPLPGDNAFLWLATESHEVPEAELQAAINEDNEAYKKYLDDYAANLTKRGTLPRPYQPLERSRFPSRRPLVLGDEACQLGQGGSRCLDVVSANPAATRYLVNAESGRLETARRALASGHVADTYADFAPYQTWDPIALELTAAALEAVEGRVPPALQRACGLLAWARRLSTNSTPFQQRIQAWSVREAASSLLLDLRRRHPEVPLTPECRDALAPAVPMEFDVCESARAEFRGQLRLQTLRWQESNLLKRWLRRIVGYYFSDERLGKAWLAQRHAPFCRDSAREALAAGSRVPPRSDFVPAPLACIAAIRQCGLMRRRYAYRSALTDSWSQITNAYATQQLLDAAHARLDRNGNAPAPIIPGYEVREDAAAQTWTIDLRYGTDGTGERTLRLSTAAR